MRLTVPRRGGWRAWGAVRADFERALADPVDPAIASAQIASELRRGVDYVRVTVALTVITTDVADALAIAWDAFRSAARDDPAGWEVAAAAAQVQPEPPLTGPSDHSAALRTACLGASRQRARDEVPLQLHPGSQAEHVAAFLPGDGDRVLAERAGNFLQRQAVLADLDEVAQQLGFRTDCAVIQADHQAVQPFFAVNWPHEVSGRGSDIGHMTSSPARCGQRPDHLDIGLEAAVLRRSVVVSAGGGRDRASERFGDHGQGGGDGRGPF